eukprot:m.190660 g.190660  ORF g.190660 m.190660 type:complete len:1154 (-) comp14825_c2_seq2:960-4421(-)
MEDLLAAPFAEGEEVNPLHYAAATGNKKAVQQLLKDHSEQDEDGGEAFLNVKDTYGRTALIYAVVSGNVPCAEVLVRKGINVDEPDLDGRTALHWSCFYDKLKMVRLLLANKANPLIKDQEGRTSFHLASAQISDKCFMAIAKAISKELSINDPDNYGMTCAHWAAFSNSVAVLKAILLKFKGRFLVKDGRSKTLLHWASQSNEMDAFKFLLSHWNSGSKHPEEADAQVDILNHPDGDGYTALQIAIASGAHKLAHYILSTGNADVSHQDAMGRTAMHWATHSIAPLDIVRELHKRGGLDLCTSQDLGGATPLHYAALVNHTPALSYLLEVDEVVDVADEQGRTALMIAAMSGNTESLGYLLNSNKVDIHATDFIQTTALHMAAFVGSPPAIEMLLSFGSDIDRIDAHTKSPIAYACENGNTEVVRILLTSGANLSQRYLEDKTLLHIAALGGHSDVVGLLLTIEGTDVNAQDEAQRTPLQSAAFMGDLTSVKLLLAHGADVDMQDNTGISALHWAVSKDHIDVVKALLEFGAFVNHTEFHEDRLTPLDYANLTQNQEMIELLHGYDAMTIDMIRDKAAEHVQSWWKSYRARIALSGLWLKHLNRAKKMVKRTSTGPTPPLARVKVGKSDTKLDKKLAANALAQHKQMIKGNPKANAKAVLKALQPRKSSVSLGSHLGDNMAMQLPGDTPQGPLQQAHSVESFQADEQSHSQVHHQEEASVHQSEHQAQFNPSESDETQSKAALAAAASHSSASTELDVPRSPRSPARSPARSPTRSTGTSSSGRKDDGSLKLPPVSSPRVKQSQRVKSRASKDKTVSLPAISSVPGVRAPKASTRSLKTVPIAKRTSPKKSVTVESLDRATEEEEEMGSSLMLPRRESQTRVSLERKRVNDIRHTLDAATTIQRAFRSWLFQGKPGGQKFQLALSKNPRIREGAVNIVVDPEDKQQQIAALTIQLAWRQHIGKLKAKGRKPRKQLSSSEMAQQERQQKRLAMQQMAYTSATPVVQWKPTLMPSARPSDPWDGVSPAMLSFSNAMSTYTRPIIELQRQRLQQAEMRLKAKQTMAEQRLATTEEAMRRVMERVQLHDTAAPIPEELDMDYADDDRDVFYQPSMAQLQEQQKQYSRPRPVGDAPRVDPYEIIRQYNQRRLEEAAV